MDLTASPPDPAADADEGILIVDLSVSRRPDEVTALTALVRTRRGVAIGVAGSDHEVRANSLLVDALTTTLVTGPTSDRRAVTVADMECAIAVVRAGASRAPLAAASAATLLEVSPGLGVREGLTVESLAYSALQGGPEFVAWLAQRPRRACVDPGERIRVERHGDDLRITLNRPSKHNAIDRFMREALLDALEIALQDPEVRIELGGAGPSFCSGGDLDEFGTFSDPISAHLLRTRRSIGAVLHTLAPRLRVDLHGFCSGAGVELAAFAGFVSAAQATTLQLPELGMGLVPGAGGTVSLPRRIGRWRTAWMLLTGTAISAETALEWGLIDVISD